MREQPRRRRGRSGSGVPESPVSGAERRKCAKMGGEKILRVYAVDPLDGIKEKLYCMLREGVLSKIIKIIIFFK
jgi:hypothetical protein